MAFLKTFLITSRCTIRPIQPTRPPDAADAIVNALWTSRRLHVDIDGDTDGDTDGSHTDGSHTDGSHTDGSHTDGSHTDGSHTDGDSSQHMRIRSCPERVPGLTHVSAGAIVVGKQCLESALGDNNRDDNRDDNDENACRTRSMLRSLAIAMIAHDRMPGSEPQAAAVV